MDVGKVVEYDDKPNISTWNDKYCDTYEGTDGTIFHPYFNKNGKDLLIVYNTALCRIIRLHYDSKVKTHGKYLIQ